MSLFNRWTMALARAVPRIGLAAALMTSGLTAIGQTANPTPYSYTLVTNYTYRTDAPYAGLLATKTVQPSDATLCSVTSYGYDSTGNLSQTTVANCTSPAPPAASAFTARSSGAAYGAVSSQTITVAGAAKPVSIPAGLVMTAATNALGQQETHQFDPRFGTMLQRTDVDKLNTSWAVDDFGRTIREVRPDKTSVITRYCILNGLGLDTSSNSPNCSTPTAGEIPPDAYMFTESEEHDVNDQKISGISRAYLDRLGRTIRTTSLAYDGAKQGATAGTLIVADTVYSAYGTKLLQSDPYFLASGSSSVTGSNDAGATLYTYDALGRVSAVYTTDPSGLAGSINFARAGSAAGYANYGMRTARAALTSVAGLVTTLTNDKGLQRIEERDPQGQLLRVTDENSAQVSYEYDAFGHTTVTQDALGNQIAAAYDIAGDLLSTTDPDKGATTFTYDPLGEPLSSQNANELAWGTRTSMSYDPLGRMTQRSAREYTATWTYDSCPNGVGRVCAVSTTAGLNKSFAYDNLGRLVGKRLWTSAVSLPEAFSFDNLTGRLAGQTYPTGLQVAYSYSALGYPSAMTLVTPATVNPLPATQGGTAGNSASLPGQSLLWSNDVVNAFGATVQQTYGNGVVATAGFQPGSDRLVGLAANGPAGPVTNQAYGWDSLGNLSSRSESAPGPSALSETFQYGNPAWHDNLNRLTSYTVADPDMPGLSRTVSLAYNALGLLLAKSDVGSYTYNASGNGAAQPHALQSVAGSQNVSFSYDARGNVSGGGNGKFSTIAYTSFDLPDNQTGVSGSAAQPSYTWSYDENHARVQEIRRNLSSDGVHYDLRTTWYDQPDNVGGLGFEYEVNAPAAADQGQIAPVNENRHFLTAGGRVIGVLVSEGVLDPAATAPPAITGIVLRKVEYWHQDHLGSLIATTDHTGAVTARYAYDPFGKRRFTTGAYDASGRLVVDWSTQLNNGTARGFTGHEHLDDIGLIQMNGRLFDPTLGVFLQADPNVPHPQSLQSFQRYAYCEGNPLNCTDPSGFEDIPTIEITAPHDDDLVNTNTAGFLALMSSQAARTSSSLVGVVKRAHRDVWNHIGAIAERYSAALDGALATMQGTTSLSDEQGLSGAGGFAVGSTKKLLLLYQDNSLQGVLEKILFGANPLLQPRGASEMAGATTTEIGIDIASLFVGAGEAKGAVELLEVGAEKWFTREAEATELSALERACPCCFVADTPVLTDKGLLPIGQVRVGTLVRSRDMTTGQVALKPVTEVIRHEGRELYGLTMLEPSGKVTRLEVSDNHPFWVVGQGWVESGRLSRGMHLLGSKGQQDTVVNLEALHRTAPTFNLTVADFHTFFAGESSVLVHNQCNCGVAAAKETTTLYRAVTQAELKQIQKTGTFEAGANSLGGKWFAETADHARQWGNVMNGKGASTVLEVQLPRSQADQLMRMERLDGIGPARYGELEQLRGAIIKALGL